MMNAVTNDSAQAEGRTFPAVLAAAFPRFLIAAGVAVLLAVGLYARYVTSAPGVAHAAAKAPVAHLDLAIVTGLGPTGDWPAYVSNHITVPAHATVVVRIVNFDDATALPAAYARVEGTAGNVATVQPIDPQNPNALGEARTVSSLDPNHGVGHTFTIPALGINVPVAPHAVVTFTIHTGGPGVYVWRCFDPCGQGQAGWTGAMARAGYMQGTLTIAA